jgi:hypothetical protein
LVTEVSPYRNFGFRGRRSDRIAEAVGLKSLSKSRTNFRTMPNPDAPAFLSITMTPSRRSNLRTLALPALGGSISIGFRRRPTAALLICTAHHCHFPRHPSPRAANFRYMRQNRTLRAVPMTSKIRRLIG